MVDCRLDKEDFMRHLCLVIQYSGKDVDPNSLRES